MKQCWKINFHGLISSLTRKTFRQKKHYCVIIHIRINLMYDGRISHPISVVFSSNLRKNVCVNFTISSFRKFLWASHIRWFRFKSIRPNYLQPKHFAVFVVHSSVDVWNIYNDDVNFDAQLLAHMRPEFFHYHHHKRMAQRRSFRWQFFCCHHFSSLLHGFSHRLLFLCVLLINREIDSPTMSAYAPRNAHIYKMRWINQRIHLRSVEFGTFSTEVWILVVWAFFRWFFIRNFFG